jgi:hypothetical protein
MALAGATGKKSTVGAAPGKVGQPHSHFGAPFAPILAPELPPLVRNCLSFKLGGSALCCRLSHEIEKLPFHLLPAVETQMDSDGGDCMAAQCGPGNRPNNDWSYSLPWGRRDQSTR